MSRIGRSTQTSMSEQYRVEKIIDKRVTNGKNYYKVKWLNYPEDQCTWEPQRNLSTCKDLIRKFNEYQAKAQQTNKNQSNGRPVMQTEQKAMGVKSGNFKERPKETTKKKAREEESQVQERHERQEEHQEQNQTKYKRYMPSDLKKGQPPRKTVANTRPTNNSTNSQQSQVQQQLQQKQKFSHTMIPKAKSNKLTEGARLQILGMVQIDKKIYFRINQNNKTSSISREQLLKKDPISIVLFYQANMRLQPPK